MNRQNRQDISPKLRVCGSLLLKEGTIDNLNYTTITVCGNLVNQPPGQISDEMKMRSDDF